MGEDKGYLNWTSFRVESEGDGLPLDLKEPLLIASTGTRGAGKTLTLAYLGAYQMAQLQQPVWSNFKIEFDYRGYDGKRVHCASRPLDMHALYDLEGDIHGGAVIIDELPAFADSRVSGSLRNRLIGYSLMQCRKRAMSFYFSSQDLGWCDSRIRWMLDVEAHCKEASKIIPGLQKGCYFFVDLFDHSGAWTGQSREELQAEGSWPVNSYTFEGRKFWHCYNTLECVDYLDVEQVQMNAPTYRVRQAAKDEQKQAEEQQARLAIEEYRRQGVGRVTVQQLQDAVGVDAKVIAGVMRELGIRKRQRTDGARFYDLSANQSEQSNA